MMAHKDATVKSNVDGVAFLFKKNKIDAFQGTGRIAGPGRVEVTASDGSVQTLETKAIVIATGSESAPLPGVEIDETRVVSSTGALELKSVPKHLVVVGAGVIGLEIGSVWRRLGSQVTVVEFLDRILPGTDNEVAKQSQRIFSKQGFIFRLGSKVTGVSQDGDGVGVSVAPAKGEGAAETIPADIVLVAIGRRAYTEGLGLEAAGVELDERRRVKVDRHLRTNVEGVYAIGDVIAGPMLAIRVRTRGPRWPRSSPAGRARELRGHSERRLYDAGDRGRRAERGGTERRRCGIPRRQVSVLGELAGARQQPDRRVRQGAGAEGNRSGARRAHRWRRSREMIHEAAVLMEFGRVGFRGR
jgi:NADPH-dependent 2,4-dienoyl-CoA reductase/sulfur reductase-like enzyme